MLVREKGFLPLAKPGGKSNKATIAVSANSLVNEVEHFQSGIKVAVTDDTDVRIMGLIMLEPGNLDAENIILVEVDIYVLVAKQLLRGNCDASIFLAEAFDDLSNIIKK